MLIMPVCRPDRPVLVSPGSLSSCAGDRANRQQIRGLGGPGRMYLSVTSGTWRGLAGATHSCMT